MRLLTVQLTVPAVVQVFDSGVEVTVYPVIGFPLPAGACQLTSAVVLPAVAMTAVGALGAARLKEGDAGEHGLAEAGGDRRGGGEGLDQAEAGEIGLEPGRLAVALLDQRRQRLVAPDAKRVHGATRTTAPVLAVPFAGIVRAFIQQRASR